MSKTLASASMLATVLLLTGCDAAVGLDRAEEDFHFTYDLKPGGHLELTNTNGSVEITGWDRNSIDVSGTKYGPEQSRLKDVKVNVRASGDTAIITTDIPRRGDNWFGGSYGVRYRIRVPNHILLDRTETTNGSITVEHLEGGGRLKSSNGKILVSRLVGDYEVETTNGAIEIEGCRGTSHFQTTNGSVKGDIDEGSVEARSTNGAINLKLEKPAQSKPIRVSTTNGSLTLAMAEFHDNSIRAQTTHGSVTLQLPENTNAHLDAETSMASIANDLPMSSVEEKSKHELRGKLGDGGPQITATTSMGGIHIQRY